MQSNFTSFVSVFIAVLPSIPIHLYNLADEVTQILTLINKIKRLTKMGIFQRCRVFPESSLL